MLLARVSLVVGVSFTISVANVALASPVVTITAPTSGALSTGSLAVTATASSPYAVSSVRATVDTVGQELSYSASPSFSWNGTLDLSSVPRGTKTLTVTATDATGATGSSSVSFMLKGPPVVQVAAPLPFTVARPALSYSVTCATCAKLRLWINGSAGIATGTTSLSGTFSVPDTLASATFVAEGTDSDGLVTTTTTPIYVEPSTELAESATVPGEILDADATRILYRDSDGTLKLRTMGGSVDVSTGLRGNGRLTPKGVVAGNNEWRPTSSVTWGFDSSASGALVSGSWAGYMGGSTARLRNLLTDSETGIPTPASTNCFAAGAWLGPGGQAAFACCTSSCTGLFDTYLYDGSASAKTTLSTGSLPTAYFTDGSTIAAATDMGGGYVVYSIYGTTCSSGSQTINAGGGAYLVNKAPIGGVSPVRFNGGWTAYALPGSGTSSDDIWRCSGSSAPIKLSFFSGVTAIEVLAPNGETLLRNTLIDSSLRMTQKRYLATGTGLPRLISERAGNLVGQAYHYGCGWHLAIGRTMFDIAGTGCGPGDAGVDGGSLDAGAVDAATDTFVSDDASDATAVDAAAETFVSDDASDATAADATADTFVSDDASDAVVDPTIAPVADAGTDALAEDDAEATSDAEAATPSSIEDSSGACSFGSRSTSNGLAFAALALLAARRRNRRH